MAVEYIIYASAASEAFKAATDLDAILETSRRNNAVSGLTGMLLFADESFIQALEGDRIALDDTYGRILSDHRHTGVQELFRGSTEDRQFPEWSMGYRQLEQDDLPPGLIDMRPDTIRNLRDADDVVRTLFKNFYTASFPFDPV